LSLSEYRYQKMVLSSHRNSRHSRGACANSPSEIATATSSASAHRDEWWMVVGSCVQQPPSTIHQPKGDDCDAKFG
jgi:hypothetical protein